MAEGGQEDDSGDISTRSPQKSDAVEAPLNLRTEVREIIFKRGMNFSTKLKLTLIICLVQEGPHCNDIA